MFTGLVQKKGVFDGLSGDASASVIKIRCSPWLDDPLVKGESVAVQGACLTVVSSAEDGFTADVLAETLRCTGLGSLHRGDAVNLERALRPIDRLGGHIVTGHVDGTGVISSIVRTGRDYVLRIVCKKEEAPYIARKGSIAVDGVSLTISAVPSPELFEVSIIPTTWEETSLGMRAVGDPVNLEVDVIARYVERLAREGTDKRGEKLTFDSLLGAGF